MGPPPPVYTGTPFFVTFVANPNPKPWDQCTTLFWYYPSPDIESRTERLELRPGSVSLPLDRRTFTVCPWATTTYTIEAFDGNGAVLARSSLILTAEPSPEGAPPVSITATPPEVEWGGCSTLSWLLSTPVGGSAVRVVVQPGNLELPPQQNHVVVCPTGSTTYTIEVLDTAGISIGKDSYILRVPPLTIYGPVEVGWGECATLSWLFSTEIESRAAWVVVQPGNRKIPPQPTYVVVCPTEITTYTIEAFDTDGISIGKASYIVKAEPSPEGVPPVSITATPPEVEPGGCSTLSWLFSTPVGSRAVRVVVQPGDLKLPPQPNNVVVCPTGSTTYTIEVLDTAGMSIGEGSYILRVPPLSIRGPYEVGWGECGTLSWLFSTEIESIAAWLVVQPGNRKLPPQPSYVVVCPTEITTYTIEAFDTDGISIGKASHVMREEPAPEGVSPPSVSITATPQEVEWGGCATVELSASGSVEDVTLASPPLGSRGLSADGSEGYWETTVCLIETRMFTMEALDARRRGAPDDLRRLSDGVTITVGPRPDGLPACVAPVATAGSPRAEEFRGRSRTLYGYTIGGYRIPISLRARSGSPAVIDFYHANAVVDWRARRAGGGWQHDLELWMSNHDWSFPHSDCPEEGVVPGFKARLCPGTDEVSSVVCDPSGCRWGGGDEAPSCFVQEGSTR